MPHLERFDHLHVYVKDREASEAWYKRVLNLSRVTGLEFWAQGRGPLPLSNESGSIHIALFEKDYSGLRPTLALAVSAENFICWLDHLHNEGVSKVTVMDHDISWSMYFSDSDGNPYEITSYEYEQLTRLLKERESST